jgi:hypothetical protein
LSAAVGSPDRSLAATLIAVSPNDATLPLLAPLMSDADREVRRSAAAAVRDISARAARSPAFRAVFDGFLASAARSYTEHRLSAVLDAILAAGAKPGPALRAVLLDAGEPVHWALRSAIRRSSGPGSRRRALAAAGYPALASAAAARLMAADPPAEHDDALRAWPMLVSPDRRRALRRCDAGALPSPSAVGQLSEEARMGLVRLLGLVRIDSRELERRLIVLASDPCVRVSSAAERALARSLARSTRPRVRTRPVSLGRAGVPGVRITRVPGGPASEPRPTRR